MRLYTNLLIHGQFTKLQHSFQTDGQPITPMGNWPVDLIGMSTDCGRNRTQHANPTQKNPSQPNPEPC